MLGYMLIKQYFLQHEADANQNKTKEYSYEQPNKCPSCFVRALEQQTYLKKAKALLMSAAVEYVKIQGEVVQKQNRYDLFQICLLSSSQSILPSL